MDTTSTTVELKNSAKNKKTIMIVLGVIGAILLTLLVIGVIYWAVKTNKEATDDTDADADADTTDTADDVDSTASCPKYVLTTNKDFNGYDMSGMPQQYSDVSSCESLCDTNGCHWFTYDTSVNKCWTKKALVDSNYNMGIKTRSTDATCPTYKLLPGYNITNYNYGTASIETSEQNCQTKCAADAACDMYTYAIGTGTCTMKKGGTGSTKETGVPTK